MRKKRKQKVFGEGWKGNWSSTSDCLECPALEQTEKRYCFWKVIFLAKSGKGVDINTLTDCPMNNLD